MGNVPDAPLKVFCLRSYTAGSGAMQWLCFVGAQASTGRPVFIRPELPRRAELKDGPLARAAANAAAAAQRPAVPAAAQPTSRAPAADGQPGNVGRLKQEYEERAAVGSSAALPAHKACLLSSLL